MRALAWRIVRAWSQYFEYIIGNKKTLDKGKLLHFNQTAVLCSCQMSLQKKITYFQLNRLAWQLIF